ncbi:MAG: DUF4131 domain-containing protein [Chloroflexi bacterium]|nr:DUF4131 domain-containing protein [Chloroflexota bacterium]
MRAMPPLTLRPPVPVLCGLFAAGTICVAGTPAGLAGMWSAVGAAAALGGAAGGATALAQRRTPSALLVGAAVLGLGLWRAAGASGEPISPWTDVPTSPVSLVAIVDAPAETRGASATVYARAERVERPEELAHPDGRVRLALPALPSIAEGDRVEIRGRFDPVDAASPEGQRLLGQGVVATSTFPDVLLMGRVEGNAVETGLDHVRAVLQGAVRQALPEPQAALLSGLLVGSTADMPEGFRQALVASGTTHIVVVSGYNITLVAAALHGLVRRWWLPRAIVPFVGVWTFTLLAGAAPPSVRAALMATVALLAARTGRGADALAGLALAAAAMLALDPRLVVDLSFQLSVLATFGLVTLQPRIAALAPWLHPSAREPVAATLAAGLATTPLLAATFHQASLVAPVANALVAPSIPVATIGGAVGVLATLAWPPLTAAIGPMLLLPTGFIVAVVEGAASIPGAMVPVGEMPFMLVALYGLALLAWAALPTPEGRDLLAALRSSPIAGPLAAAASVVLAIGLIFSTGVAGSSQPLALSVLDVGEGDAVFVRTPGQRTMLIDGGPNPTALMAAVGRRMGMLERSLSIAVLTRADADRLPGAVSAVERYPPGLAIGPPEGSTLALYERWGAAIASASALNVDGPMVIEIEPGLTVELLPTGPLAATSSEGGQFRRTLIIRVSYGASSILVAPSLTPNAEETAIASGGTLRADALVVPRHGDATGLNQSLLEAVQPSVAVISVGARNHSDHPASEVLALLGGIPTFRTDLHGTVEVRADGQHLWVVPERGSP